MTKSVTEESRPHPPPSATHRTVLAYFNSGRFSDYLLDNSHDQDTVSGTVRAGYERLDMDPSAQAFLDLYPTLIPSLEGPQN